MVCTGTAAGPSPPASLAQAWCRRADIWPAPAIPVRKVIVDVTDELAEEGRARYGFAEASSDWRSVVTRPDIDVVDLDVEQVEKLTRAPLGRPVINQA